MLFRVIKDVLIILMGKKTDQDFLQCKSFGRNTTYSPTFSDKIS